MIEKRKPYRNKKILDAARDEPCLAQFPGCTGGGEDSCFRHFNESWAGKGMGQKADDCAGFIGCQHCENMYSGINAYHLMGDRLQSDDFRGLFAGNRDWYVLRAYYRTIRRLLDKGILN